MSDKKQTAVSWIEQQLKDILEKNNIIIEDSIWNHALQMEKEQIVEAYQAGDGDAYNLQDTKLWGQEFYNETYGGQDESNH